MTLSSTNGDGIHPSDQGFFKKHLELHVACSDAVLKEIKSWLQID